jgi:hypothetical protein
MNLYECRLNTGDTELDNVTPIIRTTTRGKAKAFLLAAAEEAGYDVDWTTPVHIRLTRLREEVLARAGAKEGEGVVFYALREDATWLS